jgi:hypothetical protein
VKKTTLATSRRNPIDLIAEVVCAEYMPQKTSSSGFRKWALLALVLWIACPAVVQWLFESGRLTGEAGWASRGQFGDTFGVVNSLFTGLAFAGTIYAINLQRQASIEQQSEITKQQQTQADIANAMKQQANIMKAELDLLRTQQAAADERLRLASLPAFIFVPKRGGPGKFTYTVENAGAPVRDISISPQDSIGAHFSPHERLFWKTDKINEVQFVVQNENDPAPSVLNITVTYRTLRGEIVTEFFAAKWGLPAERVEKFS